MLMAFATIHDFAGSSLRKITFITDGGPGGLGGYNASTFYSKCT